MFDDVLEAILVDPDLATPDASRALLRLARSVSGGDPDTAGDVVLHLHEGLRSGGRLRDALLAHPNPKALLQASASNAANRSRRDSRRFIRHIPLTTNGTVDELETSSFHVNPVVGLLDKLGELGWTDTNIAALAVPRQRRGRNIHAGIENAIEKLAACYGVTQRCQGCPTTWDLLRLDLCGPSSWPALVPVLREWDWSPDLIDIITTGPGQVGHWRDLPVMPPPRQERRMIEIARKMRWQPWLLQDADEIRASVRSRRVRPPAPPAPDDAERECEAPSRAERRSSSPT